MLPVGAFFSHDKLLSSTKNTHKHFCISSDLMTTLSFTFTTRANRNASGATLALLPSLVGNLCDGTQTWSNATFLALYRVKAQKKVVFVVVPGLFEIPQAVPPLHWQQFTHVSVYSLKRRPTSHIHQRAGHGETCFSEVEEPETVFLLVTS